MMVVNAPQRKATEDGGGPVGCSELFLELKGICVALGMSKPPSNITMFQFFSGIEKKLKEALSKVPPRHVGDPLMIRTLGPLHWEKIEAINQSLVNEYEVRRKMLLKRLDVTIQSFGWSDRAKTHTEKLAKVYQPLRTALAFKSRVCVAHLLAAREDLSKILRTSSGQTREKTSCAINKVLMGRVPDRGGRPNEIEPPPPEMPTVIIKMEEEEDTVEATMLGNKGKEGQDIKGGIKGKDTKVEEGVNKVKDTKVEGTKEGIRGKDTKVEDIKGRDFLVEVTKGGNKGKKVVIKVTTKMEGDSRSEEEVEGVVEGEDEEDEVGKAEAGAVEGGRILTKEGNLSSSSNMVGISIARQGSGRGFTPAELARDHQEMRFRTRIAQRFNKHGWIFENEINSKETAVAFLVLLLTDKLIA
ncbi:hypothetical protein AMELA_G00129480 [Ameiurus melas]|uniref:Protein FAM98A n=1 Tax=Ameiurus melas TaxID=219545 RepID=A0A7J6ANQ0_AMEME|nr:hypothetical protein AMELA_G00129480 [Ameiurus melas]